MTTAARPTFDPARGGRGKGEGDLSALSKQYSSRDMPSHTKLKYRQSGQNTSEDLKSRDFRRELEEKEHQSRQKRERGEKSRSFTEAPAISSGGGTSSSSGGSKKPRLEQPPVSVDADDPIEEDDDDDDEDDDSDEDDTAELLKELQKIRKERMEEQEKKDRERKEEEERIRTENLLKGNPLLNQPQGGNFTVKRRWDDDVVFKNCAKMETKKEKNFINDTIRSEFHRKFMDKYVK